MRVNQMLWLAVLLLSAAACQATTIAPAQPPLSAPSSQEPWTPSPAVATPTVSWPVTWTPTAHIPPSPSPTQTPRPVMPSPPASATSIAAGVSTATPALVPTPVPTSVPTPTPASELVVREETLTLQSYGWQSALIETAPEDLIYPYPRLDRGKVGPLSPHAFKAVIIENRYVRLTLLPELGGRLYRWFDKSTSKDLFYVNPVLKPTHWGARGWWLATGGMEWAFPVEEHGYLEWRPWTYQVNRGPREVSITVSDRDDRTGMEVQVTVTLEADRSYVSIRPQIRNPTDTEQAFQFWLNGMFALSPTNRPGPHLRFILPTDTVIVHSTGDKGLPGPGQEMGWPVYDGRDMSQYGNWTGWLGIFADGGYMGAYDTESQMGVVRVYPSQLARGAKVFGPASIDPATWTDDGSGYVELWGGLTPTFWDYATLPPGASIAWQERWYSLGGLGGLSYANEDAALLLVPTDSGVQVAVLSTTPTEGKLVLWYDGQRVDESAIEAGPETVFRSSFAGPTDGRWGVQFMDVNGALIAAYGIAGR